jgi:hypothetical protein
MVFCNLGLDLGWGHDDILGSFDPERSQGGAAAMKTVQSPAQWHYQPRSQNR